MDNFWVEDTKSDFLNKNGQALTEYILLIGVVTLMFISILKSEAFRDVFGDDSNFFKKMRQKMAFEYRHGRSGRKDLSDNTFGGKHETYFDGNSTRFFLPLEPYEQ